MKRIFFIALTLIVVITLFSSCGDKVVELSAKEGEAANGFVWENNFSEITITGYIGASNDIVIPAKINEKPVTLITSGAFSNFSGMKSLEVPGSVKKIDGAFKNCISLETVKLSEGVESINGAFEGCKSLKKISLPNSLKEMSYSFKSCDALEAANIPSNVTSLKNAFEKCTSLKTVDIAEGIANLDYAFEGCSALEAIVIPKGVISLDGSFRGCNSLKTINLPEGLQSLYNTFQDCTSLVKVIIPESVTSVAGAFSNCTSLKTLTIPENAGGSIYDTFAGCLSLETLVLPGSYKGEVDIEGLPNLKKITMSDESVYASIEQRESESVWSVVTDTNSVPYKTLKGYYDNGDTSGYGYKEVYIGENKYECRFYDGADSKDHYADEVKLNGTETTQEIYYSARQMIKYSSSGWRYGDWCVIKENRLSSLVFVVSQRIKTDDHGDYIYDEEGKPVYAYDYNDEIEVNGQKIPIVCDEYY